MIKINRNPVRTTIFTGLLFGGLYAPVSLILESYFYWPWPFKITIITYLAIYSLLLTRWAGVKSSKIILPLFLLLIIARFQATYELEQFIIFTMLIFSWIRSGICAERISLKLVMIELILSLGGLALACYLSSSSIIGVSLTIWLFSLFQSLYFIAIPGKINLQKKPVADQFEQSRCQTEKLLSIERTY